MLLLIFLYYILSAKLFEMRPPGQWKQSVVPGFDPQTFTVLDLHDGHALVYRCGEYAQYGISYNAQVGI